MLIRPETPADFDAVAPIHRAAFGRPQEAELVARLRREAGPLGSLVAGNHGVVVGRILFSPVLGQPGYYPRFGFVPASGLGVRSEHAVPDAAFMALPLAPDGEIEASGTVRYHAAFAAL